MARILFTALLFVHGLTHLIGFYSEWKIGSFSMLIGKTLQLNYVAVHTSGIFWLITVLTWITSTLLSFLRKYSFLYLAIAVIVISQLLIVSYWQDAKFATIANGIILIVIVINFARASFNKSVHRELSTMFEAAHDGSAPALTAKAALPPIVQKWLTISRTTDKVPSKIHLTQVGVMRSSPSADWMRFNATQYYTTAPPAFLWNSQIKAGMITIAGRDKFGNGKGNMLIKPLHMYTLANTSGPEIDQGTMLRYMGELMWFPEAAVKDYFHWEEIDSTSAALSMTYNGVTVKGTFTFYQNGLVRSFSAERFGNFDGEFRKETWEVKVNEHDVINGRLIASKCKVTWKLKEGDFTWMKLDVKDISYEFD